MKPSFRAAESLEVGRELRTPTLVSATFIGA